MDYIIDVLGLSGVDWCLGSVSLAPLNEYISVQFDDFVEYLSASACTYCFTLVLFSYSSQHHWTGRSPCPIAPSDEGISIPKSVVVEVFNGEQFLFRMRRSHLTTLPILTHTMVRYLPPSKTTHLKQHSPRQENQSC